MKIVVVMINLSPLVPLDFDILERVWKGNNVFYAHIKVFDCRTFIHISKDERSILDNKSKQLFS
jgi:hypothetical protein